MTGLLPGNADVSGEILYRGENMRKFSPGRFRRLRAVEAIYIPQGAGNALNPVIKLWKQVTERNRRYYGMKRKEAPGYAAALFNAMGISKPLSAVDKSSPSVQRGNETTGSSGHGHGSGKRGTSGG